ncbi:MAG TPA: SRPBCC family protein [Gemmatimonadales bacterium]|nr:SRPBCC family protein [Gemmatimonadales bacterium]
MNWIDRRRQRDRRRMAGRAGAVAALALAASFLAGLVLPAEFTSTCRVTVGRPPETIWRVLTDLDGMPLWRSDVTAVERLPDFMGKPAWREVGQSGSRVLELSLAEPPRRLVIQGASEGLSSLPIRTFDLVSTPSGTEITVTETMSATNPLRRVLARFHLPRPPSERLLRDLSLRLRLDHHQVAAE